MNEMTQFDLDSDGKIDLNQVYEQPDPRSYYQTLSRLDYQIPACAEPLFRRTIRSLRRLRRKRAVTVLDVGSSYGVNAAILKHRFSLPSLFELYGTETNLTLPSSGDLAARDRELFGPDRGDGGLVTVGLDSSSEAIGYARDAGIIDHGIVANLELRDLDSAEAGIIAPVDLVVSPVAGRDVPAAPVRHPERTRGGHGPARRSRGRCGGRGAERVAARRILPGPPVRRERGAARVRPSACIAGPASSLARGCKPPCPKPISPQSGGDADGTDL